MKEAVCEIELTSLLPAARLRMIRKSSCAKPRLPPYTPLHRALQKKKTPSIPEAKNSTGDVLYI